MNCTTPGRIGYSQHLTDATSVKKYKIGGKKHRWKNYLPDTGNSFCYMNPDICYTIKGTEARRRERKEKLEEEKILRELAFHLLSQDRASGE